IHTVNRTLTLSGLTAGNTYDLEFYGSRAFASNSRSIFRVGNLADTINTDNNVNDYAKLSGVLADNAGRIMVTLSFTGTYNYIAGFSITESQLISRMPVELNGQPENWLVYPNPFSSVFNAKLNNSIKGKYSIVLTDLSGKILQLIRGVKVNAQETVVIRARSLNKGMYRITLVNGEKIYHQTIAAY
ncbi:MAG: T9SS type A sorting domain-containing protein, partial [Chitinophagaceae bacterium]